MFSVPWLCSVSPSVQPNVHESASAMVSAARFSSSGGTPVLLLDELRRELFRTLLHVLEPDGPLLDELLVVEVVLDDVPGQSVYPNVVVSRFDPGILRGVLRDLDLPRVEDEHVRVVVLDVLFDARREYGVGLRRVRPGDEIAVRVFEGLGPTEPAPNPNVWESPATVEE